MPPSAPRVSYANSQLTIQADNSTLADVLTAVRAQTGARVDVPAGAGSERVVAQLGPGNPRDILSRLLEGSKFDYILLGSDTDPTAVTQVIVTPRAGVSGALNASSQPGAQALPAQPTVVASPAPDTSTDEDTEPDESTVPQVQQPAPQIQPGGPPNQANPQVKTPEQLLQELQRMQQQQQQQQPQQQQQQPPQEEPPNRNRREPPP